MNELDDFIYFALRVFDFIGAVTAGVLLWRRTKRRARTRPDLTPRDVDIRFGIVVYLIGTGLLFGRALMLNAPGGFHLALISIPLIWTLRPLIRGEIEYRKDRRDG